MTAKNDDIVELYYENFYVELLVYDDCVHVESGEYVYGGSSGLEDESGSGSGFVSGSGSGTFGVAKTEIQIFEDDDGKLVYY